MINHVAIIMDGNRRWAKANNLPVFAGHQKGYQQIEKIVDRAKKLGIKYVTFWAFSTENWNRSEKEITYLMNLFRKVLKGHLFRKLVKNGGKICILGNLIAFPEDIRKEVLEIVKLSRNNAAIHINIGLNYGGREEILQAVQKIVSKSNINPVITEEIFSQYLYTQNQPDPDLIIRTGGANRLSGFLPWQSVYSELYFTKIYWPDFNEESFDKAIATYEKRERRFGK